ncbi:peptidase domain-containing ABC transporter [Pseudoalteromonas sp. JC3]|uniref:peptidase domain-containing ABC transporter n=1 Tax=Pseudoalteromonas sp. JC3 TaxID=2810196 RepID=UPI0019D2834E|nr:peptidase domain-containing ABC transporter [Pseudoalteromonas sp. JC3]MBR8842597.1 peptidase domain-containing ABC transporter [Pseudoalteromonas sp. JC3]WJE10072.1 peptidase domain-containing ABC transporter [Pseudoalteromonas sp. JC3]
MLLNISGKLRLPIIRQTEAAECGLASLAMVSNYYGHKVDLATLRRKYTTSLQGMTLRAVMDVAVKMEFTVRPIKAPLELISQVKLPAILHWDMNHFVVLKSVNRNSITIHDPAKGIREFTREEFSKHYTGVALELSPSQRFQKVSEISRLRLSDLWGRIFGLKHNLIQILLLSCIIQAFALVTPFYLQVAVDEVIVKYDIDLLIVLSIGFAVFTIINFISKTMRGHVILYFASMLSFQMASNLFRHVMRLPVDFFEKRHIGDIVTRFGSLEPLTKMLTESLVASVIDGIMAVTTIILMYLYSPKLATIAVIALIIYMIIRLIFYKRFRIAQEDAIASHAKENTTFIESIRGITCIKLFGGEAKREFLWQNHYADKVNSNAKYSKMKIWFDSANTGIFGLEHIILVFIAANLVMSGDFTVGMIFAFMAYKQNFTEKASSLVETLIEFRMLSLHLERIADLAHAEQEKCFDTPLIEKIPLKGRVSLEAVSYRYSESTPWVFRNINLFIESGDSVAVIGPSGGGKTTLFKVLTGLFQPDTGEVCLDGIPVKQYGLSSYRSQVGVVMQDDELFAGSIAENISFFDQEIDMELVVEAAKSALIYEEIMQMPMKFESLVGDMGAALSGGQKQRVLLARALYRKPKILFMDEGTAHLDIMTEKLVNQSISSMGITRIFIAHRPDTIRSANKVYEINNGDIREVSPQERVLLGISSPKTKEKSTPQAATGLTKKSVKEGLGHTKGINAPSFV